MNFLQRAEEKAFSRPHRQIVEGNIAKYNAAVVRGKEQFADLERARRLAKNRKWYAIEHLPELLEAFERNFTARGGKVLWASNAEEAQALILDLLERAGARSVVKSKSMISEEIELNELLQSRGMEVWETDLGEFIVQLLGQKPYHIVTPAMHLLHRDIAELFRRRFGTPGTATPEELTLWVRAFLRPRFAQAQAGITGANFWLADSGHLVLTENEGNARLTATLPPLHIAVVGIEKALPSVADLELFLPLLATHGTGQRLTVYNSLLGAPRPGQERYLIFLDNGRSNQLADPLQRQALYCIRCGACLNACPVYRTIGGHAYDTPYTGPIGAVVMPYMEGAGDWERQGHLSQASSLCGNCSQVCPLHIDLHRLLLDHRAKSSSIAGRRERWMWALWAKVMSSPRLINSPRWAKRLLLGWFARSAWGSRRTFPEFPKRSFRQIASDELGL